MERTKHTKTNIQTNQLQTLSEIVARASLATKLGQQYGGDRDLYQALGYPTNLTYQDFVSQYLRQDIAKAIIDRPVKISWSGPLSIVETGEGAENKLEEAWKKLERAMELKSKFIRLDKLTGLGTYGALLLGFNDIRSREDYKNPVNVKAGLKLLYLRPLSSESAKIATWEKDPKNKRYGLPKTYDVTLIDPESNQSLLVVHHSRILHVVDEALESEVEGSPRLESVYNRLMDLEKLVGGSAEMFWRGARPGYAGQLDPEFTLTPTEEGKLQDQIDEYEHNLRRILVNQGIKLESLDIQISDPKNHVDVQLMMISAVTGIPKRILSGSERGELSSAQDSAEWTTYVQTRREEFVEPHIIRPFIDLMIEYGILPSTKGTYEIEWKDLFAVSEKDRVDIGKARALALREYFTSPLASEVVTPKAFLEYFLGLSREQIDTIVEMTSIDLTQGLEIEDRLLEETNQIKPEDKNAPTA